MYKALQETFNSLPQVIITMDISTNPLQPPYVKTFCIRFEHSHFFACYTYDSQAHITRKESGYVVRYRTCSVKYADTPVHYGYI